jgi:hypothetical protein
MATTGRYKIAATLGIVFSDYDTVTGLFFEQKMNGRLIRIDLPMPTTAITHASAFDAGKYWCGDTMYPDVFAAYNAGWKIDKGESR